MPIFELPDDLRFPRPDLAEPNGLLAVGGDLSAERLLSAYASGIFPWYADGEPLLWWSPDPRLVLDPRRLHVPKSLQKRIKKGTYRITLDQRFETVIRRCAERPRPGQAGTWITTAMIDAYVRLHHLGFAHSAEAWDGEILVGGLYGVSLGGAFFGESMFAERDDASKTAFVHLVERLKEWDFDVIDCQMTTEHLLRFGAQEVARADFLAQLQASLTKPTRRTSWADR